MIPSDDVGVWQELPDEHLWTPSPEYWDDHDTIGHYHDMWPLMDLERDYAADMLDREAQALALIDRAATDRAGFERLARAIESAFFDDKPDEVSEGDWDALGGVNPDVPAFDGLELGVAGLVTVLGSLDCIPSASCRGHPDPCNWENYPLVMFVADLGRARLVRAAAASAGCGLQVDGREIKLWAPSVAKVHLLAKALLQSCERFDEMAPAAYVLRSTDDRWLEREW